MSTSRGWCHNPTLIRQLQPKKQPLPRVESAEAARKDAEDRLSYTVITAPYSGIVLNRLTDIGASVSEGTPIIEGLSLDQLRIQVDIPQQHIGPLRLNRKARVLLPDGSSIDVSDLRIPPSADPSTHSFRVLMQLPAEEHSTPIYPGTLAKVAFVQGETEQLVIPSSAVAMRGEVTGVYVLTDDKKTIAFRYLRLGEKLPSGQRVVLSGLEAGEHIAQDPVAAASAYKTQHFSDPQ